MRTQIMKLSLVFLTIVGIITGCNLVKDLQYTVEPNPLEMHGDSVAVTLKALVPEKGFNKRAVATITPVLIYEGGEKELKSITVQGEKVEGNNTVIPAAGKEIAYHDKIAYQPEFEKAELKVKIVVGKGSAADGKEFMSDKIADGTIVTPYLLMNDDKVLLGKDEFMRITQHSVKSIINFAVNSAKVRNEELTDADIILLKKFIQGIMSNEKITLTSLDNKAYASPEGEITLNENLANERAESAATVVAKELKKRGVNIPDGFFKNQGVGEDWEGFKEAMAESSIQDKDLILRVLQMYSDPNKREQEIRNLSQTFTELKKEILPELRRTQMSLEYDLMGKSDEELTAYSKSTPDSLTVEELLFAATLTENLDEKLRVYKEVARIYPQDWRGPSNVGYILMLQNKMPQAKEHFEKAHTLNENPVTYNNLGVVARREGDRATAKKHYQKALSAGQEVSYNLGLVRIQDGKYSDALNLMAGAKTFNVSLAHLLSGDVEGAIRIVQESPSAETATGYYLRAIANARTGKNDEAVKNLKTAIQKEASLKSKASKDAEFLKLKDNAEFTGLVVN